MPERILQPKLMTMPEKQRSHPRSGPPPQQPPPKISMRRLLTWRASPVGFSSGRRCAVAADVVRAGARDPACVVERRLALRAPLRPDRAAAYWPRQRSVRVAVQLPPPVDRRRGHDDRARCALHRALRRSRVVAGGSEPWTPQSAGECDWSVYSRVLAAPCREQGDAVAVQSSARRSHKC